MMSRPRESWASGLPLARERGVTEQIWQLVLLIRLWLLPGCEVELLPRNGGSCIFL